MNAQLLAKLISAGVSADLVAEVAVELGRAEAAIKLLDERRAKDRERKRVPRNSVESEESAEIHPKVSLDKEKSPRPPKEINPIPCVSETPARGWHRLPADWMPRQLPAPVQAKVDQWPPGTLDDELADFRRWAANAENKNGKGRKLDWDQAWRNWIGRRHSERHSRTGTHSLGRHQPADGLSSTARAALSVFGR